MEEEPGKKSNIAVYIGTAGYSYEDWAGAYYPEGLPKGERLSFYAREFSFTEINSSYYRLPNRFMMARMSEKTPAGFVFAVKAYRSLTHDRGPQAAEDCRNFLEALSPLRDAGKQGPVLLQFPYSFVCNRENRRYLERVGSWLVSLSAVVEFRHRSWVREDTWELLRSNGMGYACVDEPRLPGLVGPVVVCTSRIAYVRFHGRNAAKWWKHEKSYERYEYLYTEDELRSWLPGLKKLVENAGALFVVFNYHFQGQAVQNARLLRRLLGQ